MGTYAVTGGASGIGSAICQRLIHDGHRVIVVDLADGDIQADLLDLSGRQKAIDGIRSLAGDGLDGFIPCAGIGPSVRPLSHITRLNYFAAVAITESIIDLLVPRRGAVVMMASNSATMVSHNDYVDLLLSGKEVDALAWADAADGHNVYAGAKHALCCWMRRQAPDLARQGVRINAVAPGIIDTPLSDRVMLDGDLGAAMRDFAQSVPLGQIGRPEQIAAVVAFLLSDAASFMTGAIVFADGGHDAMLRPDTF